MPEPTPLPVRRRRGPSTPEGKARSAQNALKHGLRARSFGLLPGESQAEWALHLGELRASYRPQGAGEEKLVAGMAAAQWQEIRAERTLVEVLAEIPPAGPGRSHGTALAEPRHAAALGTAIRYHTAVGMAAQRALRTFLAHRKAVKDGLVDEPDPAIEAAAAVPAPANQNCTNEFPAASPQAEPDAPEPAGPDSLGLPVAARAAGSGERADDKASFLDSDDGIDDATWLASLPVVEADPEREAERRQKLMQIKFRQVRRLFAAAPLARIEQHLVIADPVAYEEWFARQPKPPRGPAKSLTAEDAALVERVTRHNPPWIRGPYLGYHRPPVPAHLFLPGATGNEAPAAPAEPAAAPPETPAALRARILRLLDRSQPRLPAELDLAEAICAVRWPNWPAYRGPIDLDLLRLALAPVAIDAATLTWLDSHELARACREGA